MSLIDRATEPTQTITARDVLVRGLLAGLVAGLLAFVVAYVVGEPATDAAIAVEQASSHPHETGETHTHDAGAAATEVPRSLQSTLGLLTGTVVAGVTLGGLAGIVSGLALGRFGRLGPRATALGVAAVGFATLYAVPALVYPPDPPGVGESGTIGLRSATYFLFVAVSVLAGVAAVLLGRWLAPRWGGWYATLAALVAYLVVALVASLLVPRAGEVPPGYPAEVLYDFRLASLLTQLTLWAALGIVLAELLHRSLARTSPSPVAAAAR